MGLFDKFKDIIGDSDDDDFDDYSEDSLARDNSLFSGFSVPKKAAQADSEPQTYTEREDRGSSRKKNDKVLNIHATAQLQVVLVKPEKYDEAVAIADNLNAKRTIVLNLEGTNRDIARRLLDFLSGVAYANNGQIKRIANSTYILTPYNVDVMGDLIDELENNGMFM